MYEEKQDTVQVDPPVKYQNLCIVSHGLSMILPALKFLKLAAGSAERIQLNSNDRENDVGMF